MYNTLEASLKQIIASVTPDTFQFVLNVRHMTYVCFAVLFFAFQHIPQTIYISINKRQFNPYNFINIWDFIIFCIFFAFIIVNYGIFFAATWKEQSFLGDQDRSLMFMRNMVKGRDHLVSLEVFLLVIMVFCMWIRAIFLLRYNEFLGKLTGVV